MQPTGIHIEKSWMDIDLDTLFSVVMIVGDSDTGKTTFAQYLCYELTKSGRNVAYLDGDPGQSTLGPPSTMTVKMISADQDLGRSELSWRIFIGSISPKGHMLQTLVGAKRLTDLAISKGSDIVLYDTNGLIDPLQGGLTLKLAELDLLRPSTLIVINREDEINPLLQPLRNKTKIDLKVFQSSKQVKVRDKRARQEYRKLKFKKYFYNGSEMNIKWSNLAVFPAPSFAINRLIALENTYGYTVALGIVTSINRSQRIIKVLLPKISIDTIDTIRLGDILLDPNTFQDRYM